VIDRIEEAFAIGVQNPVHLSARDRDAQRIRCVVLGATRAEAIAETKEVVLDSADASAASLFVEVPGTMDSSEFLSAFMSA